MRKPATGCWQTAGHRQLHASTGSIHLLNARQQQSAHLARGSLGAVRARLRTAETPPLRYAHVNQVAAHMQQSTAATAALQSFYYHLVLPKPRSRADQSQQQLDYPAIINAQQMDTTSTSTRLPGCPSFRSKPWALHCNTSESSTSPVDLPFNQ